MSSHNTPVEKALKKLIDAQAAYTKAQANFDAVYGAFKAQGPLAAIAPAAQVSGKQVSTPKPLKNEPKKADAPESESEHKRAARALRRANYKKRQDANDKGRTRVKLTDADFETAKSDVVRLYELDRNDTQIGQELNIKRALVTQIRNSLGLKGKAQGRPKTKSTKETLSDNKPKSKIQKTVKHRAKESPSDQASAAGTPTAVSTDSLASVPVPEELKSYLGEEQELGEGRKGCRKITAIPSELFNPLQQRQQIEKVGAEWFFITKR